MRSEPRSVVLATAMLVLAACRADAPQALGTLEWDRVTLPSPVVEKIVRIDVREGEQVAAGAPLLQLELTRTQSHLHAAQAQALFLPFLGVGRHVHHGLEAQRRRHHANGQTQVAGGAHRHLVRAEQRPRRG